MKKSPPTLAITTIAILLTTLTALATAAEEPKPIPLWPDMKVETTQGSDTIRERGTPQRPNRLLVDVRHAMLIPIPPPAEKAARTAIIICCGGGYAGEAIDKEGFEVARWLNSIGVTAIILEYRLPKPDITGKERPFPLIDAQRAIRHVRSKSKDWNLDPNKIGIMGFSAGGHLASTVITHLDPDNPDAPDAIDRQSARPDFAILGYPVISLKDPLAHKGSRKNLLGPNPDPAMLELYSNELHVSEKTPPTFIFHAKDDRAVPLANTEKFYAALQAAKVPSELQVYEKGGHGFGMGQDECAQWTTQCAAWLKAQGFLGG